MQGTWTTDGTRWRKPFQQVMQQETQLGETLA